MFRQYIDELKAIRDALAAGRFGEALRRQAALSVKLADLYDVLTGDGPPSFGSASDTDYQEFEKELAATEAECSRVNAAPPTVGANPLAILAMIKAGIELARMIRDLLKNKAGTDEIPTA